MPVATQCPLHTRYCPPLRPSSRRSHSGNPRPHAAAERGACSCRGRRDQGYQVRGGTSCATTARAVRRARGYGCTAWSGQPATVSYHSTRPRGRQQRQRRRRPPTPDARPELLALLLPQRLRRGARRRGHRH
eukprot:364453-Chlamydomonas_euryale.AAC.17